MGRDRIRGIIEDGEQPPSCIRDCSDDLVAQQVVLQSARKHGAGEFDAVDLADSAVRISALKKTAPWLFQEEQEPGWAW
jgi:hypothetical protein